MNSLNKIFFTCLFAVAPATALIYAVDSSQLVPEATYAKAKGEGFTKAIIRGYEEACGVGGEVDPNWVGSYNNARAAGITNIDVYWFPCTGSGHSCKSFATQVSAIGATFDAHNLQIGRIWIDLEYDSVCNNWNYGASGNLAVAKQIVSAIEASGYVWGIYSSIGEWETMFGSSSVVLDSSVPLWYADWDGVESLTLETPFGGWKTAYAKQYTDVSASGYFDLNVFSA